MIAEAKAEGHDIAADAAERVMLPSGHAWDCDWHLDQYPWECTCGKSAHEQVWVEATLA
jgi:hypothetical protein